MQVLSVSTTAPGRQPRSRAHGMRKFSIHIREGRVHIITEFPELLDIRDPIVRHIQCYIPCPLVARNEIFSDHNLHTHFILDPTLNVIRWKVMLRQNDLKELEKATRLMIYRMHYRRVQRLCYRL